GVRAHSRQVRADLCVARHARLRAGAQSTGLVLRLRARSAFSSANVRICTTCNLLWTNEQVRLVGRCRRLPSNPLRLERRPAAAGRCDVWVSELEARAVRALDVVDLRLVEVLEAQRVDVQGHPVRLEALVEIRRLVLEIEVVL